MASTRTYSRSFAGGELSAEMFGRIDDARFQAGAAKVRNCLVTPTGAVKNRAGFAFVKATKANGAARLIPFTFSLNQTMVIELGNEYARFHTQGETLQYSLSGVSEWVAPSGDISYTTSAPAIITWNGHGLTTGQPLRFYAYGAGAANPLPGGMQLGYTYTVSVIDANNFNLLDGGNLVNLTAPSPGSVTYTNYGDSSTPSVSLALYPDDSGSATSSPGGSFASIAVAGGVANLNLTVTASVYKHFGFGNAFFQYSSDSGTTWYTVKSVNSSFYGTVTTQIPIANLNTLKVRVVATGSAGSTGSVTITSQINAWSVDVPTGGSPGATAQLRCYRYYTAGDVVSYGGNAYVAAQLDSGGTITPGTNAAVWYELPADYTYEIPTPYAAADLFSIHYVQSNDVMTLVHPNYPPQTLKRLGATAWTMTPESFGPPLDTPQNVAVAASPGYLAKISAVATGGTGFTGQALITTASSHTLALGSPVYVANWSVIVSGTVTTLDGFYLVSKVPVDGSGNLIANQLYLMDYNGNNVMYQSGGSYSGSASIQYGTKIFNITSPYAVQAFGPDGISSSLLSASVSVLNDLNVPGSFNTVSWSAVDGALSYYVYKQNNGLWGFIGSTQTLSFVDNNIAPDMGITPGTPYGVFAATGDYPSAVCYYQQRKCFAGTLNAPNNVWMSNSGTESMFSYSLPSLATDAVVFRVAATQADVIQHLIPMLQLIMLTSESEFALAPAGTSSVTPSSIDVNPQSYIGASNVQPTVINTTMLYAAARGGHVRELGYAWTVNGYMTNDLSLRAAHLFDGLTIVDQAYSKSPYPMVWFVSSNGKLLGLTYIPEEQIGAWHQHDTQGTFESVACVSEGAEDVLYAVVNRTVNGATVRYVERMASRFFASLTDAFLVDAGITQTFGAAVTTVSGLTWLEGCTVSVLADGGVQTQKVVTGGAITLDHSAETVAVGLPYVSDLQTLPPVIQVDGYGQGRMKNVNKGWVRVYQSGALLVGPDENNLTEIAVRTNEPWGTAPSLQTGELPVMTTPSWQDSGQVLIRQVNPLPMEVVSLTLEVAIGG